MLQVQSYIYVILISSKNNDCQGHMYTKATFGEIHTLLKEYRRIRKRMKDKRNRHGAVGKSSSEQHFRKSTAITIMLYGSGDYGKCMCG